MNIVVYDGSFEGFLTATFEVYEYKIEQPFICKEGTASLFGNIHHILSNEKKCKRVYEKLKERLTPNTFSQLYKAFLSEIKDIENVMLRYIQYLLASKRPVENDYSNQDVLTIQQTSHKVHREKHRMEAFVRFQLTKDNLYYAIIEPDFNVLPLIVKHFKNRYQDQQAA